MKSAAFWSRAALLWAVIAVVALTAGVMIVMVGAPIIASMTREDSAVAMLAAYVLFGLVQAVRYAGLRRVLGSVGHGAYIAAITGISVGSAVYLMQLTGVIS